MLFNVYILFSTKSPKTYVGYSSDLEKRIKSHNDGKVFATKSLRPWKIIYREMTNSLAEAKRRELYWKSATGRRNIKKILDGFPPRLRKRGEAPALNERGLLLLERRLN